MSGLLARLRARIPLEEGSLVLITMIWGATFIIIRSALEATGPFFFVGVRFAFAALALILFSLPLLKDFTWREVWAGMCIGLCIFGGYALQTCGLQTITASKSAFITAFYVPLVPLLQWLVMKRPPHLMAWVGIALAFPGVLLLSGPDDSSAGFGWGEMLTAISALAIAMEIILISLVARSVNARRVTIVQVLMASLLSFATMPLVGESVPPPCPWWAKAFRRLPGWCWAAPLPWASPRRASSTPSTGRRKKSRPPVPRSSILASRSGRASSAVWPGSACRGWRCWAVP